MTENNTADQCFLTTEDLRVLLDHLERRFGRVFGPVVRDQAVRMVHLNKPDKVGMLPRGWSADLQPGVTRLLHDQDDPRLFQWVLGPDSLRQFVFPSRLELYRVDTGKAGSTPEVTPGPAPGPMAVIGLRPCDVAAMLVQDKVFTGGKYKDNWYQRQRSELFVVAINCGVAASTCFCTSMGTGPEAREGFDLALTEIYSGGRHGFVARAGSAAGRAVLAGLGKPAAAAAEISMASDVVRRCAESITRTLDREKVRKTLVDQLNTADWTKVAETCLACGNCTLVCPTCFCSTVSESTSLDGHTHTRERTWDSCFTMDHSWIHGGHVRKTTASRYRQWITHKLSTHQDQFGTQGCVGCGRCVAWCPVGIDLVASAGAVLTQAEKK